ncbi:methyltransferase domain-containing protein [bacterium]|nr:methyltransferase domain-containing protein [bacterium]
MEKLRRTHNQAKRDFIQSLASKGDRVLDVGCGRGGDLHKWKCCRVKLWGVDPDRESIAEAQSRAENLGAEVHLSVGDVLTAPTGPFDIVCYNFSLQYIFASEDLLERSIQAIRQRVAIGGVFVGVVPDSSKILKLPLKWSDSLGNTIERGPSIGQERVGEMILVKLSDGPYYAKGAVPEPLCHKEILIEKLVNNGFQFIYWGDMLSKPNGLISDIYSQFIFKRVY